MTLRPGSLMYEMFFRISRKENGRLCVSDHDFLVPLDICMTRQRVIIRNPKCVALFHPANFLTRHQYETFSDFVAVEVCEAIMMNDLRSYRKQFSRRHELPFVNGLSEGTLLHLRNLSKFRTNPSESPERGVRGSCGPGRCGHINCCAVVKYPVKVLWWNCFPLFSSPHMPPPQSHP
jgi:hypothetical protein